MSESCITKINLNTLPVKGWQGCIFTQACVN